MNLGANLSDARRKKGLSQEQVAEKLGVSRQTISKWETDETLPDIKQAKRLSSIYGLTLDELIEFDVDIKEIEESIEKLSEEKSKKVDWTKIWGKKYPVLVTYQDIVDTTEYKKVIQEQLDKLKKDYGYNDLDAMLVFKDILSKVWNKK